MDTYTVVINGEAQSGLTLVDAYQMWKTATGNVHMVKDSEYNKMLPECVGA